MKVEMCSDCELTQCEVFCVCWCVCVRVCVCIGVNVLYTACVNDALHNTTQEALTANRFLQRSSFTTCKTEGAVSNRLLPHSITVVTNLKPIRMLLSDSFLFELYSIHEARYLVTRHTHGNP